MTARKMLCLPVLLWGFGCESPVPDPPPLASPTEIPSAAPRALGALAAGTDGAPRPDPMAESPHERGGPDDPGPLPEAGAGGEGAAQPGVNSVPL